MCIFPFGAQVLPSASTSCLYTLPSIGCSITPRGQLRQDMHFHAVVLADHSESMCAGLSSFSQHTLVQLPGNCSTVVFLDTSAESLDSQTAHTPKHENRCWPRARLQKCSGSSIKRYFILSLRFCSARAARLGHIPSGKLAAANASVMRAAARSFIRGTAADPSSGWGAARGHVAAVLCFDEVQVGLMLSSRLLTSALIIPAVSLG